MDSITRESYIFITGASSGIGKVIATELSKKNNLILSGRDTTRMAAVRQTCQLNGFKCLCLPLELECIENLQSELATFIKEKNLAVHAFVHCAGYHKLEPFRLTSVDVLQKTFAINVLSASVIARSLVTKTINSSNLKNIIFISSNISNRGGKGMGIYSASKAALDGLMRSLAVELAPNIRVNSILPGAVKTEMTEKIFANRDVAARLEKSYPLGIGDPIDVANAVIFLLSENSRWLTGSQLTIDGGSSINLTA